MMEEVEIRGVSCTPGIESNLPRFKQVRKLKEILSKISTWTFDGY